MSRVELFGGGVYSWPMSELIGCCLLAFVVATGGGSLWHRILATPRAPWAHIAGVDMPEASTMATMARLGGRGPRHRQIGARDTRCLWAIRTLPAA
jgi:hypothetical protein